MPEKLLIAGLVLALSVSLMPISGQAVQFFTAGNLRGFCKEADNRTSMLASGYCYGYIIGVSDILASKRLFCAPNDTIAGEILDVAKKYLSDHPEERYGVASSVVESALKQAFPCK